MNTQSCYKKQRKLSLIQFFTEVPDFIALLISAIMSGSLLVVIDLFDSFGEMLKSFTTALLSKKLSKDLRFEYNYGIGKIEAISSLMCEGIMVSGVVLTITLSVYELIFPTKPSDLLIYVVGLKIIHVCADLFFLLKQRKLMKSHSSAIVKSNYAASVVSLLFDSVTLISLLTVWLFRNNPAGAYITPAITILISVYLLVGSVRRIKSSLNELTDKTLPEEMQLKILSTMARFYHRYSEFHAVKSKKSGCCLTVDLHISFTEDTTFAEISDLRQDVQNELNSSLGECIVNVVVQDTYQKAIHST